MTEFNGKTYKTLSGVVKAIDTNMKNLEKLIDVKFKQVDGDSERIRKYKKEKRKLYTEQFNALIDDKYKYDEMKELADIEKAKQNKLINKQNYKNNKLGLTKIVDNKMYSTHHAPREERMNKFLNKISDKVLPNTNTRNRQPYDRVALNGAFQEKVIYNERSQLNPVIDDSINFNNLTNIVKKALTDAFIRNTNKNFYVYSNITFSYYILYEDGNEIYDEQVRYTSIHSERLTSPEQMNQYAITRYYSK